jgi:hypothetical protein
LNLNCHILEPDLDKILSFCRETLTLTLKFLITNINFSAGKCLPEGLVDVTDCYYGFPIALSYPHFLDAEPSLLENLTGTISPNRSLHESFFVVNPVSIFELKFSLQLKIVNRS